MRKSYTITVNGKVYDVTVEENGTGTSAAAAAPVSPRQPQPAQAEAKLSGAGSIQITAGAAGKVVDIVASAGTAVKAGDPVVVLEIMKMETPVVASSDGVIASIEVSKGQNVEAGAVLATMNE